MIALSQPSAIIFNATIFDQTDTIGNGSITPNVSGGTLCYVSNSLVQVLLVHQVLTYGTPTTWTIILKSLILLLN